MVATGIYNIIKKIKQKCISLMEITAKVFDKSHALVLSFPQDLQFLSQTAGLFLEL